MTIRPLRRLLPLAPLLATGCAPLDIPRERAATPVFDPIAFFAGATHGNARLKVVFHAAVPVTVEGRGTVAGDTITLVQDVREGDKPVRRRSWHLRRVAPDRYAGDLSDAVGPVSGTVSGNALHLAFAMKGGFAVQQWLYLQPDGRSAHNRLVVRKFGVTVAKLDETIVRR